MKRLLVSLSRLFHGNHPSRRFKKRPRFFLLSVDLLEDRTTPTSTPGLEIYHTLATVADNLAAQVWVATQEVLAHTQTLEQAIGPSFLKNVADGLKQQLTPLLDISLGATPDPLFGTTTAEAFGQHSSAWIRDCLHRKHFPHCKHHEHGGENGNVPGQDSGTVPPPEIIDTVVYATACTEICDQIYVCEIEPCVTRFCCYIFGCFPPCFEDENQEIEDLCTFAMESVSAVVQTQEQAIANPGSTLPSLNLQFENTDGSPGSSTTFFLSFFLSFSCRYGGKKHLP